MWCLKMEIERLAQLRRHPASVFDEVRAIYVHVRRTNAELGLSFRIYGNLSRICLPPSASLSDSAELWRHTCFQLFIAIESRTAYHEFNFAPSRRWRVYAFRDYRDRDWLRCQNDFPSPIIRVSTNEVGLEYDVGIVLERLSELHSASPLRLGLSAIIEPRSGPLSYWALHHPAGRPDFHHPDAFALRLPPPVTE
jgi:hypothetical protein